MAYVLKIFLISLFYFLGISNVSSQNIFLLEKPGKIKNYKYYVGDEIIIELKKDSLIQGKISNIEDFVLIINNFYKVNIKDISAVYRKRYGFTKLYELFLKAGIPYFIIVSINRTINNEYPVVDKSTIIISGSLIIAGIISKLLIKKKYEIDNKKWRVNMLVF